jgi:hypothetical protein
MKHMSTGKGNSNTGVGWGETPLRANLGLKISLISYFFSWFAVFILTFHFVSSFVRIGPQFVILYR